jgi:hypothetical protein
MSLQYKVLPDRSKARQDRLRAFGITKATQASLTFARQLITVSGPVVRPRAGFDEIHALREPCSVISAFAPDSYAVDQSQSCAASQYTRQARPWRNVWLQLCHAVSAAEYPLTAAMPWITIPSSPLEANVRASRSRNLTRRLLQSTCVYFSMYTDPVIQSIPLDTASTRTVTNTTSSSYATTLDCSVCAVAVFCTCTEHHTQASGLDIDRAHA